MRTLRARFLLGGAAAIAAAVVVAEWVHAVLERAGVSTQLSFLLALLTVVAVLLAPLALALERAVFRPLGWLMDSEYKVRMGQIKAAFIPDEDIGDDEIGALLRTHNETLQLLMDQQRDLEDRVKKQREKERSLDKVNRALRMLMQLNQTFASTRTEQELIDAACRVAVEEGGYRFAWVGYAEHGEARAVTPRAYAGFEAGYLQAVTCTWGDDETGRGPTGTAIRTGEPRITRNILTDPNYTPWSEEALRRGYAASIALPLTDGESVVGALNLYAGDPESFSEDEVSLLSELAAALSRQIAMLRRLGTHDDGEQPGTEFGGAADVER